MTNKTLLGEPYDFTAKPTTITSGMTGASSGLFDPGDLAREELGDVNWGVLHTYMTRRFGPPNVGSDSYKDIARWIIDTPMDGLHVSVNIAPHETELLFGYFMRRDLGDRLYAANNLMRDAQRGRFETWCQATHGRRPPSWELHDEERDVGPEEQHEAQSLTSEWYRVFDEQDVEPEHEPNAYDEGVQAIRRTLRDLRRSVGVRDQDINALGLVKEGDSSYDYAETSPVAGRALPSYAYGEGMDDILAAVHHLGGGEDGLERLCAIVREAVPAPAES